ncbi:hypothetical protein [Flavobacterium aquidurense]|uniref:hypothetical protein n=1 Tax=Flavobacterium aquidurense TaxID=362413 RepID=UPI002865DD5C|nr:hypothetical protein [Flavobacterium aquidurense]MDR7371877.1 hypothetical protein [Flavobacterium aquidurense]
MKKILSICLLILFLFGCDSGEEVEGFLLDASLNILITNSNGGDLLDPNTPDAYDQSKIKILYLVEGKLIEKPNGTDYPRNFFIYKQDNLNIIRIFLNDSKEEKYPETYIQWSEKSTDIIKIEYNRTRNSVSKKTIWLNNELVSNVNPYLKIVK